MPFLAGLLSTGWGYLEVEVYRSVTSRVKAYECRTRVGVVMRSRLMDGVGLRWVVGQDLVRDELTGFDRGIWEFSTTPEFSQIPISVLEDF